MRKEIGRVFALFLSVAMAFTLYPRALSAYPADTRSGVAGDYTGKTVILHSNDVHGEIMGYAYIAALRDEFEEKGADVILADAGDFSQGDPTVSLSKGADAIAMMNAAGYDVATLGNHEFDFGYEQLRSNLEGAEFSVICADVYQGNDTILDPTWTYTGESGLKIGFFGMETPETQTKVNPGLIQGIRFLSKGDIYTCAQTQIDALHTDGADIVIALAHLGVDEESAPDGHRSVDMYHNTEGIDLILDGHSHTVMTAGEDGEPVQSTGTKFANIGVVVIDNASKTIEDRYLLPTEGMAKDEAVAAQAQEIIDRVEEEYGEQFAYSDILLNGERSPGNRTQETNLGDLITDAIVWKVLKEDGALTVDENHVVGLTNGGGIRASIQPGGVTRKDLNTVLPFGNTVAVVYVTGAELLEALEASTYATPEALGGYPQTFGIQFSLDTSIPYDQGDAYPESTYYSPASIRRVEIESVNGEPFDPAATYAVVTNNFCAAGGDTYYVFKNASAQFDTGIVMDEAVMEYVEDALGGFISEETYGQTRGDQTFRAAFPSETDPERTLADVFAGIPSDGSAWKILLCADASLARTVHISEGQNVTLDLNGYNMTVAENAGIVVDDGILTLTNSGESGEIRPADTSGMDALIYQYGGLVNLTDVTLRAYQGSCIRVLEPEEPADEDPRFGKYTDLNLEEGAALSAGNGETALYVEGDARISLSSGGTIESGGTGVFLRASGDDIPQFTMTGGSVIAGETGIDAEDARVSVTGGSIEASDESTPSTAVYFKEIEESAYTYFSAGQGARISARSETRAYGLYLDGGLGNLTGAEISTTAGESAVGAWVDSASLFISNYNSEEDGTEFEARVSAYSESGTADAVRVIADEGNDGIAYISGGVFTGDVYATRNGERFADKDNMSVYLRRGLYSVRPDEAYLARTFSDDGETAYDFLRIVETRIDGKTFYQVEEAVETYSVSYSGGYTREYGDSQSFSGRTGDRIAGMRVTVSIDNAASDAFGNWTVEDGVELEIVEGSLTEPAFTFIMPDRDVSVRGEFYENAEIAHYQDKVVILHSNDVHGEIMGYSYMAALKQDFERKGASVLVVDAGDFSQGDPAVSLSKGANAITMMNAAGYDVVTLGNHEFDFGYEQLMSNLEERTFSVICADVYQGDDTILPSSMTRGYYLNDGEVNIGFFGMETPETQTKVNPGLIQGIRFVSNTGNTDETLYTCAQAQIDELREDGADIVIGLTHLGVDAESAPDGHRSVDLYRNTQGIDLILDGHSHTVMTGWVESTDTVSGTDGWAYNPFDPDAQTPGENAEILPIQSTGTKFAYIGVVVIDVASKTIEDHYLLPTEGMAQDETVAAQAQEILDRVEEEYGEVFARSEILLNGERAPGNRTEETNLGDLITDAIVWKVLKEDGALTVDENHVVGITNGGGIRASIQPGDVTRKDLNTVLPFGNTVAVVYVTGAELLEALEASTYATPEALGGYPQTFGVEFTLDTTKPYDQGDAYPESTYYRPATIQRVTITAINGEPFDPAATYAVVTNNFCAAGGDTYYVFKNASAQFDTGIVMDEAVMEYVEDALGGVISRETYGTPRGDQTILAQAAPTVTPTPDPTRIPSPTPTPSADSDSKQGCYVATAVYGSYDCPEVWTLRRFRDEVLAQTWYGRAFIRLYYTVSPTAVELFGDNAWFQNFFRGVLNPWVASLQSDGFASTPYQDRAW